MSISNQTEIFAASFYFWLDTRGRLYEPITQWTSETEDLQEKIIFNYITMRLVWSWDISGVYFCCLRQEFKEKQSFSDSLSVYDVRIQI